MNDESIRKGTTNAPSGDGGAPPAPAAARGRTRHLSPLLELTLVRILEFVREPEAIFWVFIFPVLLALALGVAFRNRPAERLRIGVEEGVPGAARVEQILADAPEVTPLRMPREKARTALRTGRLDMLITAPEGGRSEAGTDAGAALQGHGGRVRFLFDPDRPQSRLARLAVEDALQRGMGREDVLRVEATVVTESGARYIDFLLPGLIGLNLMASGMWGIGFNVVDARTRKLLKLLAATPMRRSHFLLSFILSRLAFLIPEVGALVGFGWLVFGVAVRGSVVSLSLLLIVGALTFSGMGALVASRASTIEGVSGWMNFVMLPMWLLSGSFFSYARFPEILHPLIRLLPLTALNDALRQVVNEGASLIACGSEMGVLVLWGAASFALALRVFRWQ